LTLYAEAARELPAAELAAHGDGIAAAIAATSTPVRVDPETYALAIAAETALEQGDVGVAIRGLRRALARAPWWTAGHAHLAALLASVGQPDGATPCRHF
jgi:Flp pilus assembly protein TadD